MQLRWQQVEWHGHTADKDDQAGPFMLFRRMADDIGMVQSMLHGDPRHLTQQEQIVLRRRAIRAMALGFAAIDTLDRALAVRP